MATQTGNPALIIMAVTTVQKPTTAPTDRSMPPVMMTKVWPTARIAIIEPWRSRLEMLLPVAKLVVAKDRITQSSTRSASSVRPRSRDELVAGAWGPQPIALAVSVHHRTSFWAGRVFSAGSDADRLE
jgi:hypothetical protein